MMKIKPLAQPFNSEEYIQEKLNSYSKLSGLQSSAVVANYDGPVLVANYDGPVFDIKKIYMDYYKRALDGKITAELIKKHEVYVCYYALTFKPPKYRISQLLKIGPSHVYLRPIGKFDIHNPLMPMIRQFCLLAALSSAYRKHKNFEQSLSFGMKAVEIAGAIERYRYELMSANYHSYVLKAKTHVEKGQAKRALRDQKASGGKAKGKNAENLAKLYWVACTKSRKFKGWIEKYPSMGLKFSNELFDYIKAKKATKECPKMSYGSR